jgi:hypothetical protein
MELDSGITYLTETKEKNVFTRQTTVDIICTHMY